MPSFQYKMISGMFELIGVNKMLDKEGQILTDCLTTVIRKSRRSRGAIPVLKISNMGIYRDISKPWITVIAMK